jgi:hypothetical protein
VVTRVAADCDLVAAEIRCLAFARDELQADNVGGEADGAIEVRRANADVADVLQVDHGQPLRFAGLPIQQHRSHWASIVRESAAHAVTLTPPQRRGR